MTDNTKDILENAVTPLSRPDHMSYASDIRLVHTSDELREAFTEMTGGAGGIIELASGDIPYSLHFNDFHDLQEDAPVLIRSADPNDRAEISQILLNRRENIAFDNVEIHASKDNIEKHARLIRVDNSENIGIYGSKISSDAIGSPGLEEYPDQEMTVGASALLIRDSEGLTLSQNVFNNVNHAMAFMDSSDITVSHNEVTQIQGDGIRLAGVQNVEIVANWQHDFLGSTQQFNHSDMVQLWGTQIDQNNADIRIATNVFDVGNGPSYQMIFGQNEDYEENGWLFKNIVVEDNVIVGGLYHRISVDHTENMVVRGNTLISQEGGHTLHPDGSKTPHGEGWIDIGGINGTVENNIAVSIIDNDGSNAILTTGRGEAPSDQVRHFLNLEAGASGDLRDFQLRPDSPLNGAFGSSLLWSTSRSETLMAVADVEHATFDKSIVFLNAGLSRYLDGYLGVDDADFRWTFADGTVRHGVSVQHDFKDPGIHQYALKVAHSDGSIDEIHRTIEIDTGMTFDLVIDNGKIVNAAGDGSFWNTDEIEIVGDAIKITDGKVPEIDRSVGGLFSNTSFNIEMTVDPTGDHGGVFLHAHKGMKGSVSDDGAVSFNFATQDGWFSAQTKAGIFDDGPAHLNFVFDGGSETLSIYSEGDLMAETEATGTTLPVQYWPVTLGRLWGGTLDAELSNIRFAQERGSIGETREEITAVDQHPLQIEPFDPGETFLEIDFQSDLPSSAKVIGTATAQNAINIADQKLTIDRSADWLYDARSFDIGFQAILNDSGTEGHILHLHKTLNLILNNDGSLSFKLTTDEGPNVITTDTNVLSKGQTYSLNVGYDADAGTMQILVDGEVVAEGKASGATAPVKYWGLTFGHTWNEPRPDMTIDNITASEFTDLRRGAGEENIVNTPPAQSLLIDINFDDGIDNDAPSEAEPIVSKGVVETADLGGASVGVFDGSNSISISRDVDLLFERDAFEFDIRMATNKGNDQSVFSVHQSMRAYIDNDEFVFNMKTDQGIFSVRTDAGAVTDGKMHEIEIGYSDIEDVLGLRIDGELVDVVEASGTTLARKYWGLDIGTKWGGDLQAEIDHFRMADAADWNFAL